MVTSAPEPLRIVFFGTPSFAVPTLRALIESRHIVTGVITQPDRARGRGQKVTSSPVKALATERALPIAQPEKLRDGTAAAILSDWRPDLGVVAAYGRLIPDDLLAIPRLGMINVHGSLLPRWRGAAPVHRAVIAGDAVTGITIMRVVTALDAGAMFATAPRAIGADETSEDLERDLAGIGATLLLDVVDQMAAGTAVEEPQDDRQATYAAKITRDDGVIDWQAPAAAIHNLVRGLYPWPHAYSYLDGQRLILLKTALVPEPPAAAPGTVVNASRDGLQVATGDGMIAITELQAEGRRPMTAREFLAGHAVERGTRLGA